VLPAADAAENFDHTDAPTLSVPGINARAFVNRDFAYIVSAAQVAYPCDAVGGGQVVVPSPSGSLSQCAGWQEQVTVVDTSNGGATARGTLKLPFNPYDSGGYGIDLGWGGFYPYDWYVGNDVVQVGEDALAMRRWHPSGSTSARRAISTWSTCRTRTRRRSLRSSSPTTRTAGGPT
jgi:hypothetical protein